MLFYKGLSQGMEVWMNVQSLSIPEDIKKLSDNDDLLLAKASDSKTFLESIEYFFSGNFPLFLKKASEFSLYLDSLESTPIYFNAEQTVDFIKVFKATETLLSQFSFKDLNSFKMKDLLKRSLIALKYRLEKINGGYDKLENYDEVLFSTLCKNAEKWKQHQEIIKDKELTIDDLEFLKEAAYFEAFGKLITESEDLANTFFLYSLRDKCPVDVFVQFPAIISKLSEVNLLARIGRAGNGLLKIEIKLSDYGRLQKIVSLPFEGIAVDILNRTKTITFRGNYTLSIEEIFSIFRNKNIAVGNLEFMAEGIINWNTHKLGWWNAEKQDYETVALYKKDWWKSLPLFEIISKKVAQNRYGGHLDGHSWNAAATSTRGTPTMDYDRSHSYLELAIPCKDHEHYAIYDFGKFALKFPASFFESLQMFCHTLPATVAYPDENVFYSHRQHAQHSFVLKAKQGAGLLEAIRLDLIKARAGNFVYQIETENCAKWLYEKLEGVLGKFYNLFKMPLLKTTPFGIVHIIFSLICLLPKCVQVRVLSACHIPLGALQSIWIFEDHQWKLHSMSTHSFFKTGEVFLPAFLHSQLEEGDLEKVSLLHVLRKKQHDLASEFFLLAVSIKAGGKTIRGFNVFKFFGNIVLFSMLLWRNKNFYLLV